MREMNLFFLNIAGKKRMLEIECCLGRRRRRKMTSYGTGLMILSNAMTAVR